MLRPWQLEIDLQRRSERGLQTQIVQAIIAEIRRGRLTLGAPMPGSRALATQLEVNRKTVIQAYDELVAQGWLETQGRRGTFVAAAFPQDTATPTPSAGPAGSPTLEPGRGALLSFDDGIPDARLIPYAALSRAFRHAVIQASRSNQLGYGDPLGTPALRESLANMLTMQRGLSCRAEDLCLVRGSQMGIYLAARALVRPGDAVAFEALSYAPARAAFIACGARPLSVAQDQFGLIPEHLERLCRQHRVRALYLTPHHQYPTTVLLPAERRLRLLALAEQFGFTLVEDDYDHDFHFAHRPMLPIASIDRHSQVVYIGSMSKGLAPGLRIGYLSAAPEILARCADAVMQIDRQGNTLAELAVNELLRGGELKRHLRRTLKIYAQRRESAARTIRTQLGADAQFDLPAGGLAFWLRLRDGIELPRLRDQARQFGLALPDSQEFSTAGTPVSGIRLGYASLDTAQFEDGIGRLRRALALQARN